MIRDPGILMDGQMAVTRGIYSGVSPSRLSPEYVSFAINTTFRGDYASQRPGMRQRSLTFPDATVQARFEDGLFQQAAYYESLLDNEDAIVVLVAGRLFRVRLSDYTVLEVTPIDTAGAHDINTPTLQEAWMEQAEEFMVIQNGLDAAMIFDGVSTRRADPRVPEVPVGTVMMYALGRLWVALPNRRSFTASDLVYGPTGTNAYDRRDGVLKFTENTFLSEGGEFSVPFQAGKITAMSALGTLDTSLGQGPAQVFTERGSFSINAPYDRTTWKALTSPIQTVSSAGYGSKGMVVQVNGDLWFRAEDGLRSFKVARRDYESWANRPLSHEMDRVFSADDRALLKFASGAVFDNRLLFTCTPQFNADHGVYHLGLAALNLDGISALTESNPPFYDGLWTGLRVLKIVTGNRQGTERCYMLALNPTSNKIELWELTKDEPYDNTNRKVTWSVEFRSFHFGQPGSLKSLEGADLWLDEVHGEVQTSFSYRPDQYPAWQSWHTYTTCAQMENCATASCATMFDLKRQHRTRVMAPKPADTCETTNSVNMRFGYEFQPKLQFIGPARVMKLRLRAREEKEMPNGCTS